MVFSSSIFMFGFLAAVLPLYFLAPKNKRNLILLIFSLFFFYAWDMPLYSFIMIFSTVFDYFNGRAIGYFRSKGNEKATKAILILSVVGNLAILCFYKYTNLFISGINSIANTGIPLLDLALPIGISFYTFQTMSYTIDVYLGGCSVQKDIISFGTYVTMFPQLIAGPIVRYVDVEREINERKENLKDFGYGVKRLVYGLAKKVILANSAGAIWTEISKMSDPPVLTAWIGAIAFSFQIFFDFSGYSDMAIGMGRMFGFKFLENFNLPYISKSITEFWRRWHISLGTWFKEYVYIPLGGNRKGIKRQIINLLIVWALTGFWHGASWNYLVWGLYFGLILILEKLFLLKRLERTPAAVQHIYSIFLIIIGWVIFANEDFTVMFNYLKNLFYSPEGFSNGYTLYLVLSNIVLWVLAVIFSTKLPKKISEAITKKITVPEWLKATGLVVLLVVSIAFMVGESYNPFLYFRF